MPAFRNVTYLGSLQCDEIQRLSRDLSDTWFQSTVNAIHTCPLEEIFSDLKQDGAFPTRIPFALLNFMIRLVTHAMANEDTEALKSLADVCHVVWKVCRRLPVFLPLSHSWAVPSPVSLPSSLPPASRQGFPL